MRFLRLARKNKEVDSLSWEQLYKGTLVKKIRERYSVDDELAILRKRDSEPFEFDIYNEYVEECKATIKAEMED